jgi:predicted Zn-dependent protease with MMP-like domain
MIAGPGGYRSGMTDPARPDTELFEQLVFDALDLLPEPFREQLGSVAIVVEDEPTSEQLRSVGVRGLFGLYQGVPRTRWGADHVPYASKITIFRGPLLRAHRTRAALERGVIETVHHEVAHHFGISDDRLRELRR